MRELAWAPGVSSAETRGPRIPVPNGGAGRRGVSRTAGAGDVLPLLAGLVFLRIGISAGLGTRPGPASADMSFVVVKVRWGFTDPGAILLAVGIAARRGSEDRALHGCDTRMTSVDGIWTRPRSEWETVVSL